MIHLRSGDLGSLELAGQLVLVCQQALGTSERACLAIQDGKSWRNTLHVSLWAPHRRAHSHTQYTVWLHIHKMYISMRAHTQCTYTRVLTHIRTHTVWHMYMRTHGGIPVQQRVRRHLNATKLRKDTQC